jgi:hypothetical protein
VENAGGSSAAVGRVVIELGGSANDGKFSVPQARLSAPQGWTTALGADTTARWIAQQSAASVSPNREVAGFSMSSNGLPSLRQFKLAPYLTPEQVPIEPPGDDPGEADRYAHSFDLYLDSQSTSGTTVGPSVAPSSSDAVLANLEKQLPEARKLGWIATDAALRGLLIRIGTARAALARKNLEAATTSLRALRSDVAAQASKGLTTEAVGLVDANIQYALKLATAQR